MFLLRNSKFLFVRFFLSLLWSFCRICPSNYPINKSHMGLHQANVLAINHNLLHCNETPLMKLQNNHLHYGQLLNPAETKHMITFLLWAAWRILSILVSCTYQNNYSAYNKDPIINVAFTAHHTPTFMSWRIILWINRTPVLIILGGNMSTNETMLHQERKSY
jgi:hypothetical protein